MVFQHDTVFYGGIEGGGTKFVCAVGTGPDDLQDLRTIRTTSPNETLDHVIAYFSDKQQTIKIRSLGLASFGPLNLNPDSDHFGYITSTPKPGWQNFNILGALHYALKLPIAIDTDVTAAAVAESKWGVAQGIHNFLYLTVGTGVGGGAIINGKPLHGRDHPEMGHILIPHDPQLDPFSGTCPFHRNCLEGLASGVAIEKRWGLSPEELNVDHPAWRLEANYLAHAIVTFIFTLSPQLIIMGGGVMHQPALLPLIRDRVRLLLNGYIFTLGLSEKMENYIVRPGLGNQVGVLGGIALAEELPVESDATKRYRP